MPTLNFRVTATVKKQFFDRLLVKDAMGSSGRGTIRALSKAGAWIRQRARSLLRPGGKKHKASAPGEPPRVHTKDPHITLKKILFAYDPESRSVVIGPVRLNIKHVVGGKLIAGVVPGVLEFGGKLGIPEVRRKDGTWTRADLRKRRSLGGRQLRVRQATYAARPYMAPAFKAEQSSLPKHWANSLRSA